MHAIRRCEFMRKNYISLFDVIGPIMIGPSSSHTSGAASIAWMSRQILDGEPAKVKFTLYGSFADTYLGHGTDRALIGGILGYMPYDTRIPDSYEYAKEAGIEVSFVADHETHMPHPNTVNVEIEAKDGHKLSVRAESVGGGRVRITKINDIKVNFTGEYGTIIVHHQDKPGMAAYITGILSDYNVNIAFMRLFREDKGKNAITIIETDEYIPMEVASDLRLHRMVTYADIIEI